MNKKMANEEQKVLCYMKALFSYDPKVKDDTTAFGCTLIIKKKCL